MSDPDKEFLTHLREQHDHWKAQSAGLQITIKSLEAERDRLLVENKWLLSVKNKYENAPWSDEIKNYIEHSDPKWVNENLRFHAEKEIDRLKAELEAIDKDRFDKQSQINNLETEKQYAIDSRDLWKSKAEKLAEVACTYLDKHAHPDREHCNEELALQKVLAEFEKGK